MSPRHLPAAACSILVALVTFGCGSGDTAPPASGDPEADRRADLRLGSDDAKHADHRTLFDRLGGEAGITHLVDDLSDRSIADPRVNFARRDVPTGWLGAKPKVWDPSTENVDRFKHHMVEFISLASGGPAAYSGRDLGAVHQSMRISNSEFDAMVGDIKTSMDKLGYAAREKRELLAIIETTRKQIVSKQ